MEQLDRNGRKETELKRLEMSEMSEEDYPVIVLDTGMDTVKVQLVL